jgi:hypothetical protein
MSPAADAGADLAHALTNRRSPWKGHGMMPTAHDLETLKGGGTPYRTAVASGKCDENAQISRKTSYPIPAQIIR